MLYNSQELLQQASQKLDASQTTTWEKAFWQFIQIWLNDDTQILLQTSGSTGKAKTLTVSKQQMVNSAKMTGEYFGFDENMNALLCLSTDYIAGKMMVVRAFVWGFNLILVEPTSNPLQSIGETIDFVAMVPMQVATTLKNEKSRKAFTKIKTSIIGGAAVSEDLLSEIKKLPNKCYATFGMTETLSHVAIQVLNGICADGYYYGLKGVHLNLDDRGCLTINAPHLHPQLLVTNDLVEFKINNVFRFLGRIDNIINSGGIKLIPEVIESKINQLINVPFFLIGQADKKLGQQLVLLIEDQQWNNEQTKELRLRLQQILDKYEIPKAIYFMEKFVRTPTEKIQRKQTLALLDS